MNNVTNQVAYLRTSRNFPKELDQLSVEINKAYIDIANVANARTIGEYPTKRPAITGNKYYIKKNQGQQSLRRIYPFTSFANIPHQINFNEIEYQVAGYGNYTDLTNWYGIIDGTNVSIAGQISFYLTKTDIIFLVGAGAPPIGSGYGQVILEWASDF